MKSIDHVPFRVPEDGWYTIGHDRYRLNEGTVVDENLLPTLDPKRQAQNDIEGAAALVSGVRPHLEGWCKSHRPERHEQNADCVDWGPVGTMDGQIARMWPEAERVSA